MQSTLAASEPVRAVIDLRTFSRALDDIAFTYRLNEHVIESRLHELESAHIPRGLPYWLAYARLAELAFFLAGAYVDHGEVTPAGDLLVNPRCVSIRLPGGKAPVVKERHTPLTEQFSCIGTGRVGVARWLARNARVEIRRHALLPHMQSALQSSGAAPAPYLRSLDDRMKRIADGLAALCLPSTGHPPETERSKSTYCGFDLRIFNTLGKKLAWALGTDPSRSVPLRTTAGRSA